MLRATCAITAGKSTGASLFARPKAAPCRAWCTCFAARSNALDGTQPVFRQSPPIASRSINVTLARTAAAM